jgi:hypothetical protein
MQVIVGECKISDNDITVAYFNKTTIHLSTKLDGGMSLCVTAIVRSP